MPFYDYYSEETEEEKEIFHGINEEPEVLDSKGNVMKRKISESNFIMGKNNKDSTRRTTTQQRHGHKPGFSRRTPSEAAHAKAQKTAEGRKEEQVASSDPYYKWRNT